MSTFIANRDQALTWYSTSSASANTANAVSTAPGYAILTTSAIVSTSQKLADFEVLQSLKGFNVTLATENDWGGGTGDAAAANIRNWLINNYISLNLEYVLMIGNPDPVYGDVPMKMLWPRYDQPTNKEAPSDYYYSVLTGNWDLNGDGFAGEYPEDFGPGGIETIPDVYVGRIPYYGVIGDLDHILQKTIDYQSAVPADWNKTFLLPMKALDSCTPSYNLGENIRTDIGLPADLHTVRFYDGANGLNPPPEYCSCDCTSVQDAWSQGAGLVFWMTHGSPTLAESVFSSDECASLDDSKPSIVYAASCLNGQPEISNNLGYSLLDTGAITTLSASRVSWYYVGETDFTCTDSIGGIGYQYAKFLLSSRESCGRAATDACLAVPMNIWANQLVLTFTETRL